MEVIRVPGNFHIGHHGFKDIVKEIKKAGYQLDNSFKINHLSFGRRTDFDEIEERFPDAGIKM